VSPIAQRAGGLQYVEVLGDRLTRGAQPVPHGQPRAQLEQRLAVPADEFVEDRSPGQVSERLEDVAHSTRR
jgi:hypothetical protein